MLPGYFDCIFVHLRQKVRLRPVLSPKFLSTLGPNPTRKARPDLQLCYDSNITQRMLWIRIVYWDVPSLKKLLKKKKQSLLQVDPNR